MGVEFTLREAFTQARRYRDAMDRYEEERVRNPRAIPPRYNERLEILADVLDGNIMIHAHSYRADEILMLLDVVQDRSEEHTSELQSRGHLVCRLLLEKKKKKYKNTR